VTAEVKDKIIVSTIVPAFNEEGNIDEFCELFAKMHESAPFEAELVYIDDGSTDGTLARIKANAARYDFVRYVSHQRNRGLTEALQSGFAESSGDIYVFYPADLQYLPEDIPALVEPVLNGADVCTGWKQGKYNKRFVSTLYNWFSRTLFGLKVHDLNSVKAFRREVVNNVFLRKDWHRYLVPLAANEGYRIEEVKVPLYERKWGKSKFFSIWRIPVGVLDMMAVKFQITFLRKPLLAFGVAGLVSFGLGVLVGLWAVYLRYVVGQGERPLLYLVILLVGLGMGLFLMGFISEGVAGLKEEITDLRKKSNTILEKLDKDEDKG